ncbi:succinyl-diaminopimelate desuccinylase [Agromyces arachidis]|uniref:succinyl-diaminopimelate desuccinylase n=1 Tax=Agromyces arachidis TaxID=766966 RepID=UPI0040562617
MAAHVRPTAELDLSADVVAITQAICDVPSVSGDEGPLADLIVDALAEAVHLEVIRDGDTIIARTNLGRARRVVIAGHLDTVPINDNLPTTFEEVDGRRILWGRGTVDMKAGVAVQLKLAHDLVDPAVDVTWMWYDHEEVMADLNGLGRVLRVHPELFEADFAILGEPTRAEVEGGCNGTLRVDLRARGRRAHSARSWVGENAIHKLAPALERLAAHRPETVEVDGLEYREGLNAVLVHGGVAGNVIPDEAVLTLNYRFAPSRSVEQATAHVRELFPEYEVTVTDSAEGARPGLDDPLARQFVAAVGADARPKYGWTDVARFSALGIPAVNFGPGDPMLAHADDERVDCDEILACERALRAWLTGGAEPPA